jgi:hypothetical protein
MAWSHKGNCRFWKYFSLATAFTSGPCRTPTDELNIFPEGRSEGLCRSNSKKQQKLGMHLEKEMSGSVQGGLLNHSQRIINKLS